MSARNGRACAPGHGRDLRLRLWPAVNQAPGLGVLCLSGPGQRWGAGGQDGAGGVSETQDHTWSELFPGGRDIFYEGDDPAGAGCGRGLLY
jgi:hypothetical protein